MRESEFPVDSVQVWAHKGHQQAFMVFTNAQCLVLGNGSQVQANPQVEVGGQWPEWFLQLEEAQSCDKLLLWAQPRELRSVSVDSM